MFLSSRKSSFIAGTVYTPYLGSRSSCTMLYCRKQNQCRKQYCRYNWAIAVNTKYDPTNSLKSSPLSSYTGIHDLHTSCPTVPIELFAHLWRLQFVGENVVGKKSTYNIICDDVVLRSIHAEIYKHITQTYWGVYDFVFNIERYRSYPLRTLLVDIIHRSSSTSTQTSTPQGSRSANNYIRGRPRCSL